MTNGPGWCGCTAPVRANRSTCCSHEPVALQDELGFNIALPVQPGHGARRDAWPTYPDMDPLNNVAGMMRVVSEVRAVIRWLRPQSSAIAVSGVSMGSPVAALVAHLEKVDGVAVYTPIFGLNAMIAQHLGRWGPSVRDTIELLQSDTVASVASVVDHLDVEPTPPPSSRLIVGAWHDRMAMREPAQLLHERWGGELYWHPEAMSGIFSPEGSSRRRSGSSAESASSRAVLANEPVADVSQLAIEVIAIRQHGPQVRGAEDGRAEIAGRAVDVDVSANRSVVNAPSQPSLDFVDATLEPTLDTLAQWRSRLDPLERGNEHRAQKVLVLGEESSNPVEVADCLLQTGGIRIGLGAELLDVVVQKEGVEDRIFTAVPGVDHGPAITRSTADLRCCRCLPALFDDQLGRRLDQPPTGDLDSFRLRQATSRGGHSCILDERQLS